MDDRKRDLERSDSFDELLEESLPALPPEDVAAEVTPWRRAMRRVLVGMALCTVTLNFLCLNYLLPAIGMALTLLGFRALRRENGWFMACFLTAALRAAQLFPQLALNTTILPGLFPEWANAALSAAGFILLFLQYFCLWRGLRAVREKAGLAPGAGAAGAPLLWYALVVALALLQYNCPARWTKRATPSAPPPSACLTAGWRASSRRCWPPAASAAISSAGATPCAGCRWTRRSKVR